jgi:hypothetical protein
MSRSGRGSTRNTRCRTVYDRGSCDCATTSRSTGEGRWARPDDTDHGYRHPV